MIGVGSGTRKEAQGCSGLQGRLRGWRAGVSCSGVIGWMISRSGLLGFSGLATCAQWLMIGSGVAQRLPKPASQTLKT